MFETDQKSFAEREKKILEIWEENDTFQKSLKRRENSPLFSFYDGPPFATGLPHYGHLLAGTIKDVVPRYKTMKGFKVPRRFGWDCHGLPVENEIEKANELRGSVCIEEFGIANFNEECRSIVLKYSNEWKKTVTRMGRWVDFEKTYHTMDKEFMESIWWVFSNLWDQDLVYEGFKVMPFSAQLGTPLSNFEANLNYQDVDDPSLTVMFPLEDEVNTHLLVWTTTPWTLVSNLAAAVNAKLDYVKLKSLETGAFYILGKNRVSMYFKEESEYEIIDTFKGETLKGKRYKPPFSYFVETASPNSFTVLVDDFVGEEDGTGVVHMAPAFGEADFYVCYREEIEIVCPVDQNGKFTSEVPEYENQFVKDADKDIIKHLKQEGVVFNSSRIRHRYPFCWRSDSPLIYKAMKTWFVSVEKIKEKLIEANKDIHWVPAHIKEGRFGKWLENARDWAISRNRYWGTPMPIWRSEDGDCIVIKSIEDLEKRTGSKIDDLHRHFIDDLQFEENGKVYTRVKEVFDCWFESGSMPYAQNHYPFANEKFTMETFPADFIAEGLDQTRGWFYTLNILSVALFNKPAFKNVIVNGIILAEDGNKMSKKLKNYPPVELVIEKYGADAVRLFLLHSPAVYGEDLRFSEKGVEVVLRQFLIPLWNSYVFLSTYAKIYDWKATQDALHPTSDIDRWILSRLQRLISEVEKGMDGYQLSKAVDPFVAFIEELTNWYIRRSRTRFWSEEDSIDRREAFATLYHVLMTLSKIAAPFVPFISEDIYQRLKSDSSEASVHLCDFPIYDAHTRNEELECEMELVQQVVSMGHALRKEHKLKVRQPLSLTHIISKDEKVLQRLKKHETLILEELNVKKLAFEKDEAKFVQYVIKPNFRVLGKKVGPLMKEAKSVIDALDSSSLQTLQRDGELSITLGGKSHVLTSEDVEITKVVLEDVAAMTENNVSVCLETKLNPDLIVEGHAREIINKINTLRRSNGFEVTDRVCVTIDTTDVIQNAFKQYQEFICHEILALKVNFTKCHGDKVDLNGNLATISIEKKED